MPCRILLYSYAAPRCPRLRRACDRRYGIPPSARRIEPVVKLDAAEARNNAAPTISAGSPARCSDRWTDGFCVARSRFHDLLMSVRNGPAISVLTRTVGPNARARPSVIAFSPALDAAW